MINPSKVETIVKVKCSTREWELSYKVSDLVDSATSCFTDLFRKDQRSSLFRSWKWNDVKNSITH